MTTYGYGSIHQRASDGRWMAVVELPRNREAPRRRRTFTGRTRAVVEARLRAYREANPAPERFTRAQYMDHARALGTHTEAEYWAKVRACRGHCEYCGKRIGLYEFHGDHMTPVSRGGSDAIDNIAVCCKGCNLEKNTMTANEYRAYRARRGA